MQKLLIVLLLHGVSNSFAQSGFDEDDYHSYFELSNYLTTSSEIDNVITESLAVYFRPTIERIEQLKKKHGEDDFYVIADDNNWYNYQSGELLKRLEVKTVSFEIGVTKFEGTTGSWIVDTKQSEAPAWNLILFNVNKEPIIISPVVITEEQVKKYFDLN